MRKINKKLIFSVLIFSVLVLVQSSNIINNNSINSISNRDNNSIYSKIKSSTLNPPGPLINSTCPVGNWSNLDYIKIYWTPSSDAAGYSALLDTNSTNDDPGDSYNVSGNWADVNVPGNGTYYYHVKAIDSSIPDYSSVVTYGPFYIDLDPPNNPTTGYNDSVAGVWTNNTSITYSWSDASDTGGSGVAGYSIDVATSDPGNITGITTSGTSYTDTVSTSGQYHFYVRTVDNAGNYASGTFESTQVFDIDLDNPYTPISGPLNSSVTYNSWYNHDIYANINWTDSDVGGSGIAGYSVLWSHNALDEPNDTLDYNASHNWAESPLLTNGTWYLHAKACDNAGNWGNTWNSSAIKIDTIDPTNPSISSCSHIPNVWSTNQNFDINWSGATDPASGIAGYYYVMDTSNTTIVTTGDVETSGTTFQKTISTDGIYYFHLRAIDGAGNLANSTLTYGPIKIDSNPPNNPATFIAENETGVFGTSTWTSNSTFEISWNIPSDGTGSGIYGYAFVWDQSSSTTLPTTGINTTDNFTFAPNLTQGNNWYFHIRTEDKAGNWASGTQNYGPFYIDTFAPKNPTTFHNSSTPNVWSNNGNLNFSWSGATDTEGSGVAGYSVLLDNSPTEQPGMVINDNTSGYESGPLSDGTYYFHIRTIDYVGNISATATYGPYLLDSTPPQNPSNSSLICLSGQTIGVWSGDKIITVQWSAGTDTLSGIAGYSYIWTTNSSDIPADSITVNSTVLNATSNALADGNSWYFILKTEDNAGNWNTSVISIGPFYIDTIPPSSPTSYNSNLTVGEWCTTHYVNVSWSGATNGSGSGIQGYSVLWSKNSPTNPNKNITTVNPDNVSELSNGVWYLNIITEDNCGHWSTTTYSIGPFDIDDAAPDSNPNPNDFSSSPNTINVWSANTKITISWGGAIDVISGIYGYSYIFDTNPTSTPETIVNTRSTSITITVNTTGVYYFHIIACDNAGNWNTTVQTYGAFEVDLTPPSNPTNITANSNVNTWMSNNTISVEWSGASDANSGILGYSWIWSNSPTQPGNTISGTTTNDISSVLSDGTWYFCVRSEDNAGNWATGYYYIGPFFIDTQAPTNPNSFEANVTTGSNTWTFSHYIQINWTGASDGSGSGIQGYSVLWSQNPSGSPSLAITTNSTSNVSFALSSGTWYCYIITEDNCGHWSSAPYTVGVFQIDNSPPSPVNSLSSNHTVNGNWGSDCFSPYINVNLIGQYGGATDSYSGIMGFSYSFSMNPNDQAPLTMNANKNITSFLSANLTVTGRYWIHIRVFNNVGLYSATFTYGNWTIDVTPPSDPDNFTSNININIWTDNSYLTITFTGAYDDGVGTVGYYVLLDNNPTALGLPTEFNIYSGDTYTNSSMADGIYYLHVMAADKNSGNNPVHWNGTYYNIGPFMIDTTPPTNPTSVNSNQLPGEWGANHNLSISLLNATDTAGSGIAGYSVVWSTKEGGILPNATINLNSSTFIKDSIQEGIYYLSVRTCDEAGNWANSYTIFGPFKFDFGVPGCNYSIQGDLQTNGWYYGVVTLTFRNTTTDVSGITGIMYKDNSTSWKLLNIGDSLTIENGNHTLEYYIVNGAGDNGTINSIYLQVDGYLPNIDKNMISIENLPSSGIIPSTIQTLHLQINFTSDIGISNVTLFFGQNPNNMTSILCTNTGNGIFTADINVSQLTPGSYSIAFNVTDIAGRSSYNTFINAFSIQTQSNSSSIVYLILIGIAVAVIIGIVVKIRSSGRKKNADSVYDFNKPKIKTTPVVLANKKEFKKLKNTFEQKGKGKGKKKASIATAGWKEEQKVAEIRNILRQKQLKKQLESEDQQSQQFKDLWFDASTPKNLYMKTKPEAEKLGNDESWIDDFFGEEKESGEVIKRSEETKEIREIKKGVKIEPIDYNIEENWKPELKLCYCENCQYKIEQIIDQGSNMVCPKCNNEMSILYKCDNCSDFFTLKKNEILASENTEITCPTCGIQKIRPVKPEEL